MAFEWLREGLLSSIVVGRQPEHAEIICASFPHFFWTAVWEMEIPDTKQGTEKITFFGEDILLSTASSVLQERERQIGRGRGSKRERDRQGEWKWERERAPRWWKKRAVQRSLLSNTVSSRLEERVARRRRSSQKSLRTCQPKLDNVKPFWEKSLLKVLKGHCYGHRYFCLWPFESMLHERIECPFESCMHARARPAGRSHSHVLFAKKSFLLCSSKPSRLFLMVALSLSLSLSPSCSWRGQGEWPRSWWCHAAHRYHHAVVTLDLPKRQRQKPNIHKSPVEEREKERERGSNLRR